MGQYWGNISGGNMRFAKLTGAGNDFIVLDNRQNEYSGLTPERIRKLCLRRFSIGADGLMLLSPARQARDVFFMEYFNADGSAAAMCGNGGRCIARFAVLLGLAKENETIVFSAASGEYSALVQGSQVKLKLRDPQDLKLDLKLDNLGKLNTVDFINTGVPHAVVFCQQVDEEDVVTLGRQVRKHTIFAPAGTNVNFCQIIDKHTLRLRTYERGVEEETLACGTGAAAAALLAAGRKLAESPIKIETRGGEILEMSFTRTQQGFADVWQTGPVRLVYWGEALEEATAFRLPG
jgi:diaminopimelate epimerase